MAPHDAKSPKHRTTGVEALDFDRADTRYSIDSVHTVKIQTNNLTSRFGLTPTHARVIAELAFGRAAA